MFVKAKVSLVLSGHIHAVEVSIHILALSYVFESRDVRTPFAIMLTPFLYCIHMFAAHTHVVSISLAVSTQRTTNVVNGAVNASGPMHITSTFNASVASVNTRIRMHVHTYVTVPCSLFAVCYSSPTLQLATAGTGALDCVADTVAAV